MSGETNLEKLLRNMRPILHSGAYVFCTTNQWPADMDRNLPICTFREAEGITFILQAAEADHFNLEYASRFRMITLSIHSSLDAVGFLAAITAKLAAANMSVNAVAGYYHDHLFIPEDRAADAMALLAQFAEQS